MDCRHVGSGDQTDFCAYACYGCCQLLKICTNFDEQHRALLSGAQRPPASRGSRLSAINKTCRLWLKTNGFSCISPFSRRCAGSNYCFTASCPALPSSFGNMKIMFLSCGGAEVYAALIVNSDPVTRSSSGRRDRTVRMSGFPIRPLCSPHARAAVQEQRSSPPVTKLISEGGGGNLSQSPAVDVQTATSRIMKLVES